MKRMIRFSINLVLIALITLVLGEAALRAYHYFRPLFIFYDDSYNRFRAKPFADEQDFKLNSGGFNDVEFAEKLPGVYRILGLGDSFAFGAVPYGNNYLTLLEGQLARKNLPVEVLNMGIPSAGPSDYLSLLVREGLDHKPDMVLLSFFVGNDFVQSSRTPEARKWHSYSYVASLVRYFVDIRPKYEGRIIHGKKSYCDSCPTFTRDAFLQIERDRSFPFVKGDRRFPKLLDDALFYLTEVRDICRKMGIPLVVVIIPDELQINRALQAEIRSAFYPRLAADGWDVALPSALLAKRLNEQGIDHLDLFPYFADESSREQLYRTQDTHWNIAGNQLAADAIQNHILRYFEQGK